MKVSAGTVARTICLLLALANQILAVAGRGTISFADNDVYQIVSAVFMVITTVAAWWKNNSFTSAAIMADEIMKEEKQKQQSFEN